jgi:hypothetical protein
VALVSSVTIVVPSYARRLCERASLLAFTLAISASGFLSTRSSSSAAAPHSVRRPSLVNLAREDVPAGWFEASMYLPCTFILVMTHLFHFFPLFKFALAPVAFVAVSLHRRQ